MRNIINFILDLARGAAGLVTRRGCSGQTKAAGSQSPEKDFVEAANAESKAARQSLAAGLGNPLKLIR